MKSERRSTLDRITSIGIAMLFVSCAQTPFAKRMPSEEEIAPPIEFASPPEYVQPTPPEDVTKELIPPISLQSNREISSPEPRFDVTVDRADARQFFMSLHFTLSKMLLQSQIACFVGNQKILMLHQSIF